MVGMEAGAWRSGRSGGILDHWKGQDAGPTSGGRGLLAAPQDEKAIGGQRQGDMVMEAAPATPLVGAEADLLLQVPVPLLDPPPPLGGGDDGDQGACQRAASP